MSQVQGIINSADLDQISLVPVWRCSAAFCISILYGITVSLQV